MERLTRKQSWFDSRRQGSHWLVGALVAAVCVVLTLAICKVSFLNNDDGNIMYALAGYRTGTPYPTHRFINVALGVAISGLYRLLPSVPWWTLYQIAALLLSLVVINACICKFSNRAGLSIWVGVGLMVIMYLGMFAYTLCWITFTLTAGMLGTAACALVFALDWEMDGKGERWIAIIGGPVLLLLCFFTRNSSGYSLLCFFAAAVLYQFIRAGKRYRVKVAALAAGGLAVAVLAVALNSWGVARFNPPVYPEFEAARGRFIDYPHVTYTEDPEFFATLGWDETIYDLADNLCYLDPAVNADTMNAVVDYPHGTEGLTARLADTLAYGEAYFRGSGVSQYMLVIPVVILVWLLWVCARKKRFFPEGFIGCAVAAGAFLLCFYLCFMGRFPVRTFMLIAIPTGVLELLALLTVWRRQGDCKQELSPELSNNKKEKRNFAVVWKCAGIFISALLVAWGVGMSQSVLLGYDNSELIAQNARVEAYVMAHPDNVYITDVTGIENIDAFATYPADKPVNLVDWGGTGMHSGWKEAQLRLNGVEDFTGEIFQREGVYFITPAEGEKLNMLNRYLTAHWGATGYTAHERITGELTVYRFDFDVAEGFDNGEEAG